MNESHESGQPAQDKSNADVKTPIVHYVFEFLIVIVILALCGGLFAPLLIQLPLHLLFGWCLFGIRTLPDVTVNTMQCLFAVLLIAGVFGSLLWVGRSLTKNRSFQWTAQHSAIVVWMLIASFVVGLGATGVAHQVGWLLRSSEPWIEGTGMAARRMSDSNNHKQVLMAVHEYASDHDGLIDLTSYTGEGQLLHGWQTALLPFIDQQQLHEMINQDKPWNDPDNSAAFERRVRTFENPTPGLETSRGSWALTHQAGNALIFSDPNVRRFGDLTDGTANTIYSGGAAGNYSAWGHPANWRDPRAGMNQSANGFGGPFSGGGHVAMADGAVKFITDSIDPQLLEALSTPSANDSVEEDW